MKTANDTKARPDTWVKPRHRAANRILRACLGPIARRKYGVKAEAFSAPDNEPYLILYNHQTPADQFFVSLSFHRPIYFLATEDIFSKGWLSSVLRYLAAPIPIIKQTTDLKAMIAMMQVAKEGGSIAIAPEGNRTYSGKTEYMSPAIALLARRLRLPIALYRIEGGYGVQPRWSDKIRKGSMRAYVSRVIRPEEFSGMDSEALLKLIRQGLDVNEAKADGEYRSSKKAEYLERMVYVCPFCGLSRFESSGNDLSCQRCGRAFRYGADKRLEGIGFPSPFAFANDWYEYQKRFINQLDVTACGDKPLYEDGVSIFDVIVYKRKNLLQKNASLGLYGDRLVLNAGSGQEKSMPFSEITGMALIGRNRLNVYHDNKIYQFRGNKRFNAMKYMHIYYRCKNMTKGNGYGEFLGL